MEGVVIDLVHCPAHSCPLAKVSFNGKITHIVAPEGIKVGDTIRVGAGSALDIGNTLPLKEIPEGTMIFNIESNPGDGGKFVRASGTLARVAARHTNAVLVTLPSKKTKSFNPDCRASIGICAGGGRPDKPILKAGVAHFKHKAKNKLYPIVSGISQNAVDHPFGGKGSTTLGRPTTVSRTAPPGRKVGHIAAKRTGRKK